MVEFYKFEKTINQEDLEIVENKLGFKIPEEYAIHLLKYNGGKCKPNIFSFIENGKKAQSDLDWFLAIYDGKYDNLLSYIEIYKIEQKRLPLLFVPIAHDSGGNLICISCFSETYGYIYFWDHEKESVDIEKNPFDNTYLIAKSFNQFIVGFIATPCIFPPAG